MPNNDRSRRGRLESDGYSRSRWLKGSDCGAATVLWVAMLMVILWVAAIAIAFAEFAVSRTKADTAADLAALAGAQVVLTGDPCGSAKKVAADNDAAVTSCDVQGTDVVVTVERPVGRIFAHIASLAGKSPPKITIDSRAGQPTRTSSPP